MKRSRTAIPPQILDEASYWFVEMREPEVATEQREAFAAWLCASPVHIAAYLEIAKLWGDASGLSAECAVSVETDQSMSNVVQMAKVEPEKSVASGGPLRALHKPLMAAVLVVSLVVGLTVWWKNNPSPTYVTGVAEQRLITLEDGSVIRLNARSQIRVRMSKERRQLDLISGQALFEVAHDTKRPFIVNSGDVMVRAVGTKFDVNRRSSGTIVTVVEGKVSVDRLHQAPLPRQSIPLGAGEQATVSTDGSIKRNATANIAAATSWLQRELIFDGQPLRDVVEEFNRHLRTPIVLTDPSLQDIRISAVFHTLSPDSLIRFLSRLEDVEIQKSESEIRVSRAPYSK